MANQEQRSEDRASIDMDKCNCEEVFWLTKYPESLKEVAARAKILEAESSNRLEVLSEAASEWNSRWDSESPSAGEVSVDEERIRDPKGVRRMELRWCRWVMEVLGKRERKGPRTFRRRRATPVAEAANQVEQGEGGDGGGGGVREPCSPLNEDKPEEQEERQSKTEPSVAEPSDVRRESLERRDRAEIFWTRSRYEGQWDAGLDIPCGEGVYRLPYGVTYAGDMHDGQLEGHGVMHYPDGSTVEGEWRAGQLQEGTFEVTFRDALRYDLKDDWDYCTPPDRRFHIERLYGLRGAGRSHLTQGYPTRNIPAGCYDTGDGFYDPSTRCVVSAFTPEKVLRIPTNSEAETIKETCRKAWDENVDYLPDAFVNTYDSDNLEPLIPSPVVPDDLETSEESEDEQICIEWETLARLNAAELYLEKEKCLISPVPPPIVWDELATSEGDEKSTEMDKEDVSEPEGGEGEDRISSEMEELETSEGTEKDEKSTEMDTEDASGLEAGEGEDRTSSEMDDLDTSEGTGKDQKSTETESEHEGVEEDDQISSSVDDIETSEGAEKDEKSAEMDAEPGEDASAVDDLETSEGIEKDEKSTEPEDATKLHADEGQDQVSSVVDDSETKKGSEKDQESTGNGAELEGGEGHPSSTEMDGLETSEGSEKDHKSTEESLHTPEPEAGEEEDSTSSGSSAALTDYLEARKRIEQRYKLTAQDIMVLCGKREGKGRSLYLDSFSCRKDVCDINQKDWKCKEMYRAGDRKKPCDTEHHETEEQDVNVN